MGANLKIDYSAAKQFDALSFAEEKSSYSTSEELKQQVAAFSSSIRSDSESWTANSGEFRSTVVLDNQSDGGVYIEDLEVVLEIFDPITSRSRQVLKTMPVCSRLEAKIKQSDTPFFSEACRIEIPPSSTSLPDIRIPVSFVEWNTADLADRLQEPIRVRVQDFKIVVGNETRSVGEWRRLLPDRYVFATVANENGLISRKMIHVGSGSEESIKSSLEMIFNNAIEFDGAGGSLRVSGIGAKSSNVTDWGNPSNYSVSELNEGSWLIASDSEGDIDEPLVAGRSFVIAFLRKSDLLNSLTQRTVITEKHVLDAVLAGAEVPPTGTFCHDPSPKMRVAVGDRVELVIAGKRRPYSTMVTDFQDLPDPPDPLENMRKPLSYRGTYKWLNATEASIQIGTEEIIDFSKSEIKFMVVFSPMNVVPLEEIMAVPGNTSSVGSDRSLKASFQITRELIPLGYSSVCISAEIPPVTLKLGRSFTPPPLPPSDAVFIPRPGPDPVALMASWRDENPLAEQAISEPHQLVPEVTIIQPLRASDDPLRLALEQGAPETLSEACKYFIGDYAQAEAELTGVAACGSGSPEAVSCAEQVVGGRKLQNLIKILSPTSPQRKGEQI